MISLPQLVAKDATIIPSKNMEVIPEKIIPSTEEKVYDKYWVTQMSYLAPSPSEEAKLIAVLSPARDVELSIGEKALTTKELLADSDNIVVRIDNVFSKSDKDSTISDVLTACMMAIIKAGKEQGVLK
jgi:hypothetical protein